jgi:ATP-dependent Clp protease ATP-binding subunit ClpX
MNRRRRLVPVYCSFCGKQEDEVFTLVPGPMVWICDECVSTAQQLITDRKIKAGATAVIRRVPTSEQI